MSEQPDDGSNSTPSARLTEGWDDYTQIGHKKGRSIVWYLLPGGRFLTHLFTSNRDNHNGLADGPEAKAIAVGRIDPDTKKISVRTPLAPGNSWVILSDAKLDYIRRHLERDYPDFEIWYYGNGARDIRRIDSNYR